MRSAKKAMFLAVAWGGFGLLELRATQGLPGQPAGPQAQEADAEKDETLAEVEELLRRFAEGEGLFPAGDLDYGEEYEDAIRLYRASDSVEVIHGGERRTLLYWDAHLELSPGDEVVQGPKGRSIISTADGSEMRFDGVAVFRFLSEATAEECHLQVDRLEKFLRMKLFDTPTTVDLPGGNQLVGKGTLLSIYNHEFRAVEIRNTGPQSVELRGPFLGRQSLTLKGGQKVLMPVFQIIGQGPAGDAEQQVFADGGPSTTGLSVPVQVVSPRQVQVSMSGQTVELYGSGSAAGIARVVGARLRIAPGATVRLQRAPLGVLASQEN